MRFVWLAVVAVVLLIFGFAVATVGQAEPSIVVTVHSDGTVTVAVRALVEPGLNELPAPVEAIPATIEAMIDNVEVPAIYHNGSIYIASDSSATATVTYIANVTMSDGILEFYINYSGVYELHIEPGIVTLTLPENILGADIVNDTLVLLVSGPAEVRYVIVPAEESTGGEAAGTASQPAETSETQQPSEQPTPTREEEESSTLLWVAVVVAAAAVAAAILVLARRGGSSEGGSSSPTMVSAVLDDTDKLILKRLQEAGGSMLQSELQRATGLPKTTLWRHVRRLAELGYVRIEKEGKANRVILVKELEDAEAP
ncbi:helix-turn-helix transcriptional regulator [Hyperthermus butylicus]|uniref:Conserved archaeal protein n=1 Tax=Hyperthermus butylicus (strain DSM 5456 / JCM 9403 / PLM1-5) TaxID=415426 RepID=A2BLP2_HYPBU|nr:winged helix-turn-helix transcriptional regulator [Hyperthermus butylicus]ABM80903.1 conserved archaeal protein [Hyperthermus butylicus DSM 5456]